LTSASHQGHPPLSNKHLWKWLRGYKPVFSWACFNAFQLKDHPERANSHIFLMVIEPDAQLQTGRKKKKKKKKQGAENEFHIALAILLTRDDFLQKHPEAQLFFSKLDQSAAAIGGGGPSNAVSTDMVLRCGNDWDCRRLRWEQKELDEMQQDEEWALLVFSIVNEKALYQIVDGNPVKL
jgi:hypothetical protein